MKKIIFFLFLSILGYSQNQMPNIELNAISGESVNLSTDFNEVDKLYVFSFWATWCAPCINELEAMHKKYATWKESLNVEIIAVSIDDSRTQKRVKPFLNGKGWTYNVLLDSNQELKRALSIVNVPYTIVVKNSKIVFVSNGYSQGAEEELYIKLKEL
ncbi:TlpA family protein disulfide reductase [Flavobacterium sp.]|jgi:alkyl hydroperoxide reductase subunit AhpC|uniref:TlpA family protein disulfide reductase n=1 Tax=Flavobacterium sp. TaxID=239 RepID=UPI0037BF0CE7